MAEQEILVLGASGGVGGAVALELRHRGRKPRLLVRDAGRARAKLGSDSGMEIITGDAEDAVALTRAAAGCRVILHGVNYPYHQWQPHMERVTANVIAAARATGATILFPGNVYGLGPPRGAPFDEAAAMRPNSQKGALRVRLEKSMADAASESGFRLIILRAGDYFGPTVRNGLVDRIFGNAVAGRAMQPLGAIDLPHQWIYMPDLARAAVDLLERQDRMAPVETIHFAGYTLPSTDLFCRQAAAAAGHPGLAVRAMPWWLLNLAALFSPLIRELKELRYLYDGSVILDDPRFRALRPGFAATPLADAIAATVASYRGAKP